MDIKDAISSRRSIRMYKNDDVSDEILLEGIKYATKAPSAHNRQPWKYMIVSSEQKYMIADMLEEKVKDIPNHSGVHTASVIRNAPKMIVIYIDGDINDNMDVISIGAAIENMILYFTSLDLGTLWVGNTNLINEEMKGILGVQLDTISTLLVGYKDQEPHERPRKDMKDVII